MSSSRGRQLNMFVVDLQLIMDRVGLLPEHGGGGVSSTVWM